jgi:hypothetical protein
MTALAIAIVLAATPLAAQWLHQPTPGIPRTADGKPNLAAPAPRTALGKPDLSGLWTKSADKFYNNIAADLRAGDVQPWADTLYQQRKKDYGKDSMEVLCLPHGPAYTTSPYRDSKIIQTPAVIAILNNDLTYRQIFMDGRELEHDPNPNWMGYSVGHWDGDTLVVESNGYNDKTWLDYDGHPHTESLRVTERYRRPDFGHIELEVTLDDPKAYAKPWTVAIKMELTADTEILEMVCDNEKDRAHMPTNARGSDLHVPPETLRKYAGTYEAQEGSKTHTVEVSASDDALFWDFDGAGKQKLVAVSETTFSLSGTLIEFVKDPQGAVTTSRMQEVEGETKGQRRN